jgi:hypothetical protein
MGRLGCLSCTHKPDEPNAKTGAKMSNLTAFKVTYTDGTWYITSCAARITLAEATAYFKQGPHVSEDANGKETWRWVEKVEQVEWKTKVRPGDVFNVEGGNTITVTSVSDDCVWYKFSGPINLHTHATSLPVFIEWLKETGQELTREDPNPAEVATALGFKSVAEIEMDDHQAWLDKQVEQEKRIRIALHLW